MLFTETSERPASLSYAMFSTQVMSGKFPFSKELSRAIGPESTVDLSRYKIIRKDSDMTHTVHLCSSESEDVWVYFRKEVRIKDQSYIYCIIIATTEERLEEEINQFSKGLTNPELPAGDQVKMGFWRYSSGNGGPVHTSRNIDMPTWEEIVDNYPAKAQDNLHKLMNTDPTKITGRIAMLYGPPGTGKTTLIRAITRTWAPWCTVSYVIDPERFLNDSDYLINVMLNQTNTDSFLSSESEDFNTEKWNLIILEDAGELIMNDAVQASGQAVSRLLNTADGILGQGRKILFMITTNQDVHALHDSVTRSGRCLIAAEISKFSPAEAQRWLNASELPEKPLTLAEMYAIRNEASPLKVSAKEEENKIGQYL